MRNYTIPTVLSILILALLLAAGLWLFIYGSTLEQKTVILPTITISPVLSPTPNPATTEPAVDSTAI